MADLRGDWVASNEMVASLLEATAFLDVPIKPSNHAGVVDAAEVFAATVLVLVADRRMWVEVVERATAGASALLSKSAVEGYRRDAMDAFTIVFPQLRILPHHQSFADYEAGRQYFGALSQLLALERLANLAAQHVA